MGLSSGVLETLLKLVCGGHVSERGGRVPQIRFSGKSRALVSQELQDTRKLPLCRPNARRVIGGWAGTRQRLLQLSLRRSTTREFHGAKSV